MVYARTTQDTQNTKWHSNPHNMQKDFNTHTVPLKQPLPPSSTQSPSSYSPHTPSASRTYQPYNPYPSAPKQRNSAPSTPLARPRRLHSQWARTASRAPPSQGYDRGRAASHPAAWHCTPTGRALG